MGVRYSVKIMDEEETVWLALCLGQGRALTLVQIWLLGVKVGVRCYMGEGKALLVMG